VRESQAILELKAVVARLTPNTRMSDGKCALMRGGKVDSDAISSGFRRNIMLTI
jgi:hypothetical protein